MTYVRPGMKDGYVVVYDDNDYHILQLGEVEGRYGPFYCKVIDNDLVQTEAWDAWFGHCYSHHTYEVCGYATTFDGATQFINLIKKEDKNDN